MASKVLAARLAASVGVTTIISHSDQAENIGHIIDESRYGCDDQSQFPQRVEERTSSSDGDGAARRRQGEVWKGERSGEKTTHTRFLSSCNPIPDRYLRLIDGLRGYSLLQ